MNNRFEPWHIQVNAGIKSRCGKKAVASGGAMLLAALLLAVPRIGSAQGFTPLPVIGWPTPANECVAPNPGGTVLPDATVAPYILQLAKYLETLVAKGQLTQADAIAELAATAEYFNLPAAQLDHVLGLPAGSAQAAYDTQLNPYDWYSYYFNPGVAKSGEMPPAVGPLNLLGATSSELDVQWFLSAFTGSRNVVFFIVGPGNLLMTGDGRFTGLLPATTYNFEVRAEVYNRYLQCWETVLQTGAFTTLAAPPPPPPPPHGCGPGTLNDTCGT